MKKITNEEFYEMQLDWVEELAGEGLDISAKELQDSFEAVVKTSKEDVIEPEQDIQELTILAEGHYLVGVKENKVDHSELLQKIAVERKKRQSSK